ncbi:MAG TPA: DUF11 domain-containing protein [Pseudonocardiaceae bacterium]|nr:DUF11 domain-containing protein [Pseudonocardiaceae bacterium]
MTGHSAWFPRSTRRLAAVITGACVVALVGGVVHAQAGPGGDDPRVEPIPKPEYIDDARSFVADVDFRNALSGAGAGVVIANVSTPGTEHLRSDVIVRSEGGGQVMRSTTMPHPAFAQAEGTIDFFQAGRYQVLVPFDTKIERIRLATPDGATIATVDTNPAVATLCAQTPDDPGCRYDLAIAATSAPEPVAAGTTLTYTIPVQNRGPGPAFGAKADITLPAPPSDPLPTGCTHDAADATKLVCALGRIHPGATTTLTVNVPIPAGFLNGRGQRATVSATGTVSAAGGRDADGTNDSATQTSTVVAVSDLGVTKTGSRPDATANDPVTYTVTVANAGPSDADRLIVTDNLPDPGEGQFTNVAASDGGACTRNAATNQLTCSWPTPLPAGRTRTVTVGVTVTDTGSANQITDQASAASVSTDPVAGNDRASATTRVILVPTTVTPTPVLTRLLPGVDIYVFVLTARLARADDNRPVAGRSLEFRTGHNGNGTLLCTAVTDSTGVARCPGVLRTVGALLGLGYTVTWAGDGRYLPGSGQGQIVTIGR